LDAYIRAVRWLSRVSGVVAALLIAVAVLVICDMVIVRYLLKTNTIWQVDFVTYAIIAATFVGSPYVLLHRGHVNVDILPMHSGPRFRYWLALSTSVLSLAFCAVLWWLCTRFWYEAWSQNWRSDTVWRSRLWIAYLSMPVGLGLLVLQYIAEVVSVATGRAKPFAGSGETHELLS
jgi:TRAP-type C4-dicarboxylate transport system permease small subunit